MKALVSDKIFLTGFDSQQFIRITEKLTIENPKFIEALQFGRSTRGIDRTIELFDCQNGVLSIPRGCFMKWVGADEVIDQRHTHAVEITSTIEPRTYQERALRLMQSNGGGVLVAPTGSGKTTIGIEIAARLGQRCLIMVKSKDLAEQWRGAIKKFTGLDCGLIGSGKWIEGDQFTVGLVQTLVKHEASLDYGMVIIDECHNVPAQQAYDVINRQAARYRFGLSATPQRRDNLEPMIFSSLGSVVAEIEQSEVEGAVLPVDVHLLHYGFRGRAETWPEFINQLADDAVRNGIITTRAIKASQSVGTAVLTGTIAHAETLYRLVTERGVDALLLHGQLPKKVRDERMAKAHDSKLIIGTLSLLSEGIDWPHVGCIIFAAPVSAVIDKETPAATRLIQSIGRGRRPFPGKSKAFVLDIVDSHFLGKSAAYKRQEIYRQHGFGVFSL